jgi:hypothetical protein
MVRDEAANKERDVDVTVTVIEPEGARRAFKAYEVKHEGGALDVADVEALCLKLADMSSITHRALSHRQASQLEPKPRLPITVLTCSGCVPGLDRLSNNSLC